MEYDPIKYRIKKSILILAVLIVVAFLFYFYRGSLSSMFSGNKQPGEMTGNQNPQTNKETKLSVADEKALQKQTTEIVNGADLAACQKIGNDMYKTVCRNNIILKKVNENKDASLCRQLDNNLVSIESCERDIITKETLDNPDISLCADVSTESVKKMCEQNVWTMLAIKNNDISYCQKLSSDDEKFACEDIFYFGSVIKSNSHNFDCDHFHTDVMRSDCATFKNNPNSCSQMKTVPFSQLCSGNNLPKQQQP